MEPLYKVDEVVYIATGHQQVAGPYVVVSSNAGGTYIVKRQDNNEIYPTPVPESSLRVPG